MQFWITLSVVMVILLLAALILNKMHRLSQVREIDEMEGYDFEVYCAQLLDRAGFHNVEVTKASKDYGIDILAQKDGISYAIQCKCYSGPVGIKAVQEAYAGRDYYGRMVGVVMTNQYFTSSAVEFADKLKILLWDRDALEELTQAVI